MKKIFIGLFIATLICFAISANVKGQSNEKGVAIATTKGNTAINDFLNKTTLMDKSVLKGGTDEIAPPEKSVKVSKANLRAIKANFRATKYFKKAFKDVLNPTWAVGKFGIFAYYTKDDVKTIAVFDKRGFLVHTLDYYTPNKTPTNIRSIVGNSYPNDEIALAIKVTEKDTEFFIVQLEDGRTYKQLSVCKGIVELINEYGKKN